MCKNILYHHVQFFYMTCTLEILLCYANVMNDIKVELSYLVSISLSNVYMALDHWRCDLTTDDQSF